MKQKLRGRETENEKERDIDAQVRRDKQKIRGEKHTKSRTNR